jgi:hypothetical protein
MAITAALISAESSFFMKESFGMVKCRWCRLLAAG